MTGIELIVAERRRQLEVEGWSLEHDVEEHPFGGLPIAAACYAVEGLHDRARVVTPDGLDSWPWARRWDKREKHNRERRLAIAGALIAAELDRLQQKGKTP